TLNRLRAASGNVWARPPSGSSSRACSGYWFPASGTTGRRRELMTAGDVPRAFPGRLTGLQGTRTVRRGGQGHRVSDPNAAAPRWLMPRGLIVLLGMTGLLVSVLALQQFASILAPVLLALVLVIGVHPLTGILRRRGVPLWLAVTIT